MSIDKESGEIVTGYCSCFAGLGSTCNHLAALLFKIEHAWQNGLNRSSAKACTSLLNKWIVPSLKKIEPMKVEDMIFTKPKYNKEKGPTKANQAARSLFSPSHDPSPSLEEITNAFFASCSTSATLQHAYPHTEPSYDPDDDINVNETVDVETTYMIPVPLPQYAKQFHTVSDLIKFLPNYSDKERDIIEKETRAQTATSTWFEQRIGRITGSTCHSVLAKWRKGESKESSLTERIMGEKHYFFYIEIFTK